MRNLYYYDSSKLDLSKYRADAMKRSIGDIMNEPEDCRIHFHKADESCERRNHEFFPVGGEVKDDSDTQA